MTTEQADMPKYAIDFDRARELRRAPEAMLMTRHCYVHASQYEKLEDLPSTKEQIAQIVKHCAKQADFIAPEMPLLEIAYRTILAGGNRPLSLQDLYEALTDRWATPINPRNMSLQTLRRVLSSDTFYGITEVE